MKNRLRFLGHHFGLLASVLLLFAICFLLTWNNNSSAAGIISLQNLSRHSAMLAIFAIGEGIVILSGGIDLSVGSLIAFSGLAVTYMSVEKGMNPWMAGIAVLIGCAVVGLWHGIMVCRFNLQPFIVTLCSMLFFRGLCRGFVNDAELGFAGSFPGFRAMGDGTIGFIPTPVLILVVVAIACAFLLHFSKYGRYLFAIGRNEKAVAYSGINVSRMKTSSYILCACLAGLAGIVEACYTNSVQPASTGQAYELYAIAAAVLGGCSMRAGEGTVIGVILGACILRALTSIINQLGISTMWELAVIGAVILAGVIMDASYKQRASKTVQSPESRVQSSE